MAFGDYLKNAGKVLREMINLNSANGDTGYTLRRICQILDNEGFSYTFLESDNGTPSSDIVFKLEKDEDCCKDVLLVISIDETLMVFKSFMEEYEIDKSKIPDAILFCNTWNLEHYMPKACVSEDNIVFTTWCNAITGEVSDEYIKNYMILAYAKLSWQFFCDFTKKFY